MATVTGNVFDLASAPFPTAVPVVEIQASKVSVGVAAIHTTRKITVSPDSAGAFWFQMVGTGTVSPYPEPILTIKWLDPDSSAGTGSDQLSYPLHIPAGNGTYTIDQVIEVPVQAGGIVYGMGAPPDYLSNVIYIDISGIYPVFYAPTSGGI